MKTDYNGIEEDTNEWEMFAKALSERACDFIAAKQYKKAFRGIKQALRLNPKCTV